MKIFWGWMSGTVFTTLPFSMTYRPNKLECYITQGWKGFPGTNTLAHWTYSQVTKKCSVMNKLLYTFLCLYPIKQASFWYRLRMRLRPFVLTERLRKCIFKKENNFSDRDRVSGGYEVVQGQHQRHRLLSGLVVKNRFSSSLTLP